MVNYLVLLGWNDRAVNEASQGVQHQQDRKEPKRVWYGQAQVSELTSPQEDGRQGNFGFGFTLASSHCPPAAQAQRRCHAQSHHRGTMVPLFLKTQSIG